METKLIKELSPYFKKHHLYNKRIYKYLNQDDTFRTLSNSTIFLQTPNKFNDPYDCYEGLVNFERFIEKLISSMNISKPKGNSVLAKRLVDEQFRDKIGISCFSKKFNNLLMWSHYADKHKGACIGFDLDVGSINSIKGSRVKGAVNYDRKYEPADFAGDEETWIRNWLLTKAKDWKYEKEVRLICPNQNGVIEIETYMIKEVIFGSQADELFKKKVKEIVKRKDYNLEFSNLKLKENKFKLEKC